MSIERASRYYDDIYLESESYKAPYSESRYFAMWSKLMTLIPKETPITELGCGTGQFAKMLVDNGYNYSKGYDFSHEAIKIAKSIHENFLSFTVKDLTRGDIHGDFFIACELLEHTKDYKILENIGLGCEIIFTLPDFNDPAHVRYFHSINEVVKRYDNYIKFEYIEKFEKWFICKGVTI